MANVFGNTNVLLNFQQVNTSGLPGSAGITATPTWSQGQRTWANGTGANQVNLFSPEKLTLAAAPTTIDMTTILDVFGGTNLFVKGRLFYVSNLSATDGQIITISGGATNPQSNLLTGNLILPAGGIFYLDAPLLGGVAVDGTHKTLKFDPGANTIVMELGLLGTNA